MADDFSKYGLTAVEPSDALPLSSEEQAKRDYEDAIAFGTLSAVAVKPGNKPPKEADYTQYGLTEVPLSSTRPSELIPPSEPETTAGGLSGAVIRGAAPTVAGAGAGGVLGGVIGGLATGGAGVIPGAILGARVGGAVAPILGDLGVGAINSIFNTHYSQPTEALQHFLTAIGVPEAATEAERIVQASSNGVAGAAGGMAMGGAMAGAANSVVRRIGQFLAANPEQQLASAATGSAAGQEVQEMGGGTGAQIAANVLTGMGTIKLMGSRLVNTAESLARRGIVEAGNRARVPVPVKTSDVFQSKPGFIRNTGEYFPVIGNRGKISEQVRTRIQGARDLLGDYGAAGGNVAQDADLTRLYNSFAINRQQQLTAASTLKQQAMATAGATNAAVNVTRTITAIDNQIQALAGSINEREIVPTLQRFRAAILGSNLDAVENARREVGRQFTSRGLEHIRTRGEQIINSIYAPLRNDIRDFINTHGAPGDVRRWEVANRRIRVLAEELNENTLRAVLRNGENEPEAIARLIFNSPTSRIANLYRSLPPIGQVQFRTVVIRQAALNSLEGNGLNLSRFATNIRDLDRQLHIGFSPAQRQQIEGFGRLLEATQSAEKPYSSLPKVVGATTIAATSHFLHAGWLTSFATAVGATGGVALMAKAYESALVRETLMFLARVRPGTVEYDTALRSAMEAFKTELTKETQKQEKKK
jgi:hypothetical protein